MKTSRKLFFAIFLCIVTLSLSAGTAHEWKLKEGKGYDTVKDTQSDLIGKLPSDNSVVWAREDDHGSFLTFQEGAVTVPHDESLVYPDGFIAQIRFSVNLEKAKQPWISLFSKGASTGKGYTAMLNKKGSTLLLSVKGINPSILTTPVQIQSNREYRLCISIGDGMVKIAIDGKQVAKTAVSGELGDSGEPLCLGTSCGNAFYGNLYSFAIEPWSAGRDKVFFPESGTELPIPPNSKFPPITLPDPEGTIKVVDFEQFTPKPFVGERNAGSVWLFRKDAHFVSPDAGILHPDNSPNAEDLVYDPKISGTFDLYVGIRAVDDATAIGIGLGDRWFRIDLPGQGVDNQHWSMEQLVVRSIPMDGRKIILTPMGKAFYLAYLKFIPSNNPRSIDYPKFEGYSATEIAAPDEDAKQAMMDAENNAKIAAGNYVQRHYVEERPMPELTADTRERGFMVFPCNWMELVFRDTVPTADVQNPSMDTFGTPGETLRLALAVRTLDKPLQTELKVTTPLRNAEGTELAASIAPSVVEYARKRTTEFAGDTEFMVMPNYLEPGDTLSLASMETREYMLTLKLADDAQPGIYNGVVSVISNGQRADVRVKVKVCNFKLDQLVGYDIGFWNLFDQNNVRKTLADEAAYGINSVMPNSRDVVVISGNTLDTLTVDWDKSILSIIGADMKRLGMNGSILLGTDQGIYEPIVKTLPAAQQEEGYIKIIKQIDSKAKQEGWPSMVFVSVDEVLSNSSQLPVFIKEVQWQKKSNVTIANNHIWYKTSRPFQREVDLTTPMFDIFINRFSTRSLWYVDSWEEMMETAQERNVKLMAYNSNNALTFSQPAAMRFINGWFFRSPLGDKCSGQIYWVWGNGSTHSLDDLPDVNWVYMIPPLPHKKLKGGPVYDLLGLQAGVTDLRYILTLENAIARAKDAGKNTADAEELLKSLSQSFDCQRFKNESVFFESKWTKQYDKDGKRYASGSLNIPNGWTLDQYDINRAKIAAAIEALNAQ